VIAPLVDLHERAGRHVAVDAERRFSDGLVRVVRMGIYVEARWLVAADAERIAFCMRLA
jgi:hypothetical protein